MWNSMSIKPTENEKQPEEGRLSFYRDRSISMRNIVNDEAFQFYGARKILLIDDDQFFGKIMLRVAGSKGADLTYCQNIDELGALGELNFDAIVIDYDLGAVNGIEMTKYIEKMTKHEIPVILISQTNRKNTWKWPDSIREFVHKGLGPFAIYDAIYEALEIGKIYKSMTNIEYS